MVAKCCCWKQKKEKLHSAVRLKKSRSLDRVNLKEYSDLVLEDKFSPDYNSDSDLLSDSLIMGNTISPEALDAQRDNPIMKTGSSSSLKSSSSMKSSSSRRSKVTFTEHNPEVHMIPPKSPPKPKRSRSANRAPTHPDDDIELILRDDESQSAFQFDLCQQAELTSLEDIEHKTDKAVFDDEVDTPEDVYKVIFMWCVWTVFSVLVTFPENTKDLMIAEKDC